MASDDMDVVVLGGGMAGLTAAATAAAGGRKVLVVEKSAAIGGSALISGGIIWSPESVEAYRRLDDRSDETLIRLAVEGITDGLRWVADLGAEVSEAFRLDHVLHFPSVARRFDNHTYLHQCARLVEKAGGHVVTETNTTTLLTRDSRVVGVRISDRDGSTDVLAPWIVLATGGFQGDPELRAEFLGPGTRELVLRANRTSVGDGLLLARSVGADVAHETSAFYGNLLPTGLPRPFVDGDFLRLSQYHSIHSLLLDTNGDRIGDESVAYYLNAVLVSRQPGARALLVGDERVRATGLQVNDGLDRVEEAARDGGRVVTAGSLRELGDAVAEWGYRRVPHAIEDFNELVAGRRKSRDGEHARMYNASPLVDPPYFAVEVQPGITFPFAGLRVDAQTRVLDDSGSPIEGLLAAGVDVHAFDSVYGGGLGLSLTTGRRAGRTTLESATSRVHAN